MCNEISHANQTRKTSQDDLGLTRISRSNIQSDIELVSNRVSLYIRVIQNIPNSFFFVMF